MNGSVAISGTQTQATAEAEAPDALEAIGGYAVSDTEAAQRMIRAKAELLRECKLESPFPPRFVC
jgi:hypothetical protein